MINIPEDQEGQETLSEKIQVVVDHLIAIDELKAKIKAVAEDVEDCLEVKKARFLKLAKTKYNQDAEEKRKEAEEIKQTLDILFD